MNQAVASRYAKALFDAADEGGALEVIKEEFDQWMEFFRQQPRLGTYLQSPGVQKNQKQQTLEAILEAMRPHPYFVSFLRLVNNNNRVSELPAIYLLWQTHCQERDGIQPGIVETAVPLSEDEIYQLQTKFTSLLNKQVLLSSQVNAKLIGGMITRIGSQVWDGSVDTFLKRLHISLSRG